MKKLIILFSLFISGCMQDIPLSDDFWQSKPSRIAIVVAPSQPAQQHHMGSQGLLDYAISEIQAGKINKELKKTDLGWYKNLPETIEAKFKKKNIKVVRYTSKFENNIRGYRDIARQTNADKILLIQLFGVGTARNYYGPIPLGAPKGFCHLSGEIIDVSHNNKRLWRYNANLLTPIPNQWDQPPHYPNVMETVKSTMKQAEKQLLTNLFQHK